MARPTKRPPQRSNGLGGVYPHTSGRWCAAVTLEVVKVVQDDGTVKRRTLRKVVFCPDRAAAEAALVELRRLQGLDLELTDDPTLAVYLEAWIAKRGGSGLLSRRLIRT